MRSKKNDDNFTAFLEGGFKNDSIDGYTGTAYEFYESGLSKIESTYKNGKVKIRREWFENGTLKMFGTYEYDSSNIWVLMVKCSIGMKKVKKFVLRRIPDLMLSWNVGTIMEVKLIAILIG